MIRNVLLALLISSLPIVSNAQSLPKLHESIIRQCLNEIYKMDFISADSILSVYETKADNNPSFYILKSYYLRWKYLPITKDKEVYREFTSYLDSAINSAATIIEANSEALEASYYKMSAHIMIAELLASNGDFVKGAFEGKKAFPIIKKGFDLCDDNAEFYISTGLYNYYIEYYRDKGFFYRSLLFPFPVGDKKEGLELLTKGYDQGLFTSVECLLYLAHINFKLENKPFTGLKHCKVLYEKYSTNYRFQEMYVENLLYCKKYQDAIPILNKLKKSNEEYYLSKSWLFDGILTLEYDKNLAKAKTELVEAFNTLESLPGDNDHYKSLACLKLAQLEGINGNLAESAQWLKKARKMAKYNYILEEVSKLDI